ncbi:uncharacterized protein LOC120328606 [Styela clava]
MPIRRNKVGLATEHDGEGHRVSCGRKRRGRKFRKNSHQQQNEASSYLTAVQCIYAFASWFGRGIKKTNKILTFSNCCKPSDGNSGDEESIDEVHSDTGKTSSQSANQNDIKSPTVEKHHSGIGNKLNLSDQLQLKKSSDKISRINDKEILSDIDHERYNEGKRGNALPPLGIPDTKSPRHLVSEEISKLQSNGDTQTEHPTKNNTNVGKELSDSKSSKNQTHEATSVSVPPVLTEISLPSSDKSVAAELKDNSQKINIGMDDNIMKFMKQLDDQKKSLICGLESIASTKLLFEKGLEFINKKQSQMNLNIKEDFGSTGKSTSSENICNCVYQAEDSSSNLKIDNIAETEQQLQSLINTAKRLEHFLTSSKIWTMEKSDDVKAKKFDQKSTQTTDHTISKQKVEKFGVVENKAASVITPQTDEGASTLLSSNANVAEDKFPLPSTSAIDDATVPTNDTNQSQTIEVNQLENVEVDKAITQKYAHDPFYDEPICKVRQQYTMVLHDGCQ